MLLFPWHNEIKDFDLDNILIDEKSHENILIYNISYKTLIDPKPLGIRFDIIDGFIRIYDGTRYLTSFDSKIFEAISNKSRYLINLKKTSHIFFLPILRNQSWFLRFFTYRKKIDVS